MRQFVLALALGAVVGLGVAQPSAAKVMSATYTGVVFMGQDKTGVFGPANASLAGLGFSARFIYDTGLGAERFTTPVWDDLVGGPAQGVYPPYPSPGVTASLTINGVTYAYTPSQLALHSTGMVDPYSSPDITDRAEEIEDGPLARNDNDMLLWLNMPSAPADVAQPFDSDGVFQLYFNSFSFYRLDHTTGTEYEAYGDLRPDHVTIAEYVEPGAGGVPEPAEWAMLVIGLFATGGLLRRARRLAPAG